MIKIKKEAKEKQTRKMCKIKKINNEIQWKIKYTIKYNEIKNNNVKEWMDDTGNKDQNKSYKENARKKKKC